MEKRSRATRRAFVAKAKYNAWEKLLADGVPADRITSQQVGFFASQHGTCDCGMCKTNRATSESRRRQPKADRGAGNRAAIALELS